MGRKEDGDGTSECCMNHEEVRHFDENIVLAYGVKWFSASECYHWATKI